MNHIDIQLRQGRPTVCLDGHPLALTAYSPVGGRRLALFKEQTARFFPHSLAVYLITVPPAVSPDFFGTPFWVGDQISATPLLPQAATLDEQVEHVLRGDPGARIMIRFGTHEPTSWRELHSDQLFVSEAGDRLPVPSLASELFNTMCARYATAVIEYCEARPWADKIIGYANFLRMEGTHEPLVDHWLFDHSPLMQKRFGKPVPTDKLRGTAPAVAQLLYWQSDPLLREYLELTRDLFHTHFRGVAGAMRQAAPRDRLLLYDALKQPMLGWSNSGFFDGNRSWPLAYAEDRAGSGHIGVAPLFDAAGFDGLITPHDYQARGIGGVYQPEGATDSLVLRGKLMFCEMDTRSYTGTDINYPARDDREFAAITWRNLADSLTRGYQSYWMDVYQDWFASAGIHKVIAPQVKVLKEAVHWPHADVPGIAMVLDDEAVLETNGDGRFFNEAIMWEQKQGIARCGVPYRIYLFDDLQLDNFPEQRVFYFPNLFRISAERRALLQKKVFKNGHVVLWGPGSGITEGADVTGFEFDRLPVNHQRRTLISNFDHPITHGLPADTLIGSPLAYGPVLLPKDGIRLGEAWTKGGRSAAGLATKDMGQWHSVFTTAVPIPADFWRGLARFAGAHIYCESNDVLLADTNVVALHSVQSGPKRIALPGRSTVHDLENGRVVGRNRNSISFRLAAPATRIFRIEPA